MSAAARRIVRFSAGLQVEDVPAPVVASAKLHLLDAIGVGLAASTVPLAANWADGARRIGGGDGPASVLGRAGGLSATMAALVNGALIHSLEFDDTHIGSVVHGGSVAAPTALAVAEDCQADGPRLLAAYIAAWEVMIRLGLAAPGAYQANGFQISATGGAVGAAVAASAISGLGEDQAVSAIGIAGSQASGLLAFLSDGSTVKALHPGWAAHTGIAAVALADAGMTGPETIVEGRFGFLDAFARDPEAAGRLSAHLDDLGVIWHLPDAAFKPYPCCHYIHPFLEAMQALINDGLHLGTFNRITCHVPPPMAPLICEPWDRRQNPASGYDAKWGLAYCLAALLVDGHVDVATFAAAPNPMIIDVARKIEWQPMESHSFPQRFEALVEAHLNDGQTLHHRLDNVRGAPDRPVQDAEVIAKFRANASRAMANGSVEAILQAILALDHAATLARLTAALREVRD
ncbi:MAG TPA: MmgE/PrpD family protein [Thermohalobaculum sp.]|nr:MmgE/PrpD family protein [Thermohalobaculum sp.]